LSVLGVFFFVVGFVFGGRFRVVFGGRRFLGMKGPTGTGISSSVR
jgi:hypothetical protein